MDSIILTLNQRSNLKMSKYNSAASPYTSAISFMPEYSTEIIFEMEGPWLGI